MRGHTSLHEDPWRHDLERLGQFHDPPVGPQPPRYPRQYSEYEGVPVPRHRGETSPRSAPYRRTTQHASEDPKYSETKRPDKRRSRRSSHPDPSIKSRTLKVQQHAAVTPGGSQYYYDTPEEARFAADLLCKGPPAPLTVENVQNLSRPRSQPLGGSAGSDAAAEVDYKYSQETSAAAGGSTDRDKHASNYPDARVTRSLPPPAPYLEDYDSNSTNPPDHQNAPPGFCVEDYSSG